VSVSLLLACSFTLAAFVSSAYRNKRQSLGEHHYQLGQWNESHGDPERAVAEFRKALLYLPDDMQYRLSLASALLDVGRLNEAHAHLEQLAEEHPTDGPINLMLARVDLRQQKLQQALQYYERAVYEYWPAAQLPQRRQARWELVALLGRLGDRNSEIAELMQLYASAPADPSEKAKIGFRLLENGATSEASRVFRDLAHTSPRYADAFRGLGQIAFGSGDYMNAYRNFEHAVHLDPKDADSAEELKLTNAVIELDPALPRISTAERLRRSRNLLNRVLDDLEQCAEGRQVPDAVASHIATATKLLSARPGSKGDLTLDREDAAQQLWKDRGQLCGGTPVEDQAVETVLARIGS
jgi:tetratricopeptide (TPR) repeat protein